MNVVKLCTKLIAVHCSLKKPINIEIFIVVRYLVGYRMSLTLFFTVAMGNSRNG